MLGTAGNLTEVFRGATASSSAVMWHAKKDKKD